MNLYISSFLFILIFNIIKNYKSLQALQQNLYNEDNRYLKWIFKNFKSIFLSVDLLALITILIAYLIDNDITNILIIIALGFYLLEIVRIVNNKDDNKKSLIINKRVRRLIITTAILMILPSIIYLIDFDAKKIMLLVESIITYFSYFIVLIAKYINTPVEKIIHKFNKTKAITKLNNMDTLKIVGVTGTYGKTSCTNIINDILSIKYVTKKTPKNLNTENGVILTVNNHLDYNDEILIAELGLYKQSEIKKLYELINPRYIVLTNIGNSNLENYGSGENIQKIKFEMIEYLDEDGICVLNRDDPKQTSYNIKSKCKKIWIGINNQDANIYATDIKCDYNGSSFNVIFKGDDTKYPFETKLLGNFNIYNILSGIALGHEFGINIKELQKSVKKIKQVKGRLELIDLGYMYKIDDMYNSNQLGKKVALDVLSKMPGTKVVVTKGLTDLVENEKRLNNIFGSQIAKVADIIILLDEKKTRQIFDGIKESGYDKDKLYIVNSVRDAYNLLKTLKFDKKVYALFEGNLHDTHN